MVAGVAAGEDRGVVGERDGRQRRHRAVPERRAHRHEASDVRRLAAAPPCRRARWGCSRRRGSRSRGAGGPPRARARRSRASPSWPREVRAVGRGATPSSASTVGATSTSRQARSTMPAARTPAPPMMNGARACTTSIDPCSPRWPPWSSQLCAAEWIDAQVGRATGGRRAGPPARRRTGSRSRSGAGSGSASSASSPAKRSMAWSASGIVARR